MPYVFNHWGMPFTALFFWYGLRQFSSKRTITFREIAIRYHWHPKTWVVGTFQRIIANVLLALSSVTFTSIRLYQQFLLLNQKNNFLLPVVSNIPWHEFDESDRQAILMEAWLE